MQVTNTAQTKFSLIRMYPRQELGSDMDLQSMLELNLVPTGVIIVKMEKVFAEPYFMLYTYSLVYVVCVYP